WQNPRGRQFFADIYTIRLTAGHTYTISLMPAASPTGAGGTADSFLYLLNPDNSYINSNEDWFGSPNPYASQIHYTPTVTEVYTIVVTTSAPGIVMSYPLTVTEDSPTTPPGGGTGGGGTGGGGTGGGGTGGGGTGGGSSGNVPNV